MKSEVKEKWLEALRSGEYLQGTNYLQVDDRFCCLGVLCDIAVKEGVASKNTPLSSCNEVVYQDKDGFTSAMILTSGIQEWAGLDTPEPCVSMFGAKVALSAVNDFHGKTFEEIADMIEKDL